MSGYIEERFYRLEVIQNICCTDYSTGSAAEFLQIRVVATLQSGGEFGWSNWGLSCLKEEADEGGRWWLESWQRSSWCSEEPQISINQEDKTRADSSVAMLMDWLQRPLTCMTDQAKGGRKDEELRLLCAACRGDWTQAEWRLEAYGQFNLI